MTAGDVAQKAQATELGVNVDTQRSNGARGTNAATYCAPCHRPMPRRRCL